mgnify:CR=1 FL=1
MDYKTAGVDIEAGYKSVELMKEHVKRTMREEVLGGLGGFSGAFSLAKIKEMEEPVLLSGTDGCGTKVKLAMVMDKHDTIGIDAVAMCVNDIACAGGEPLFFLDYIACGKNYPEKIAEIVNAGAVAYLEGIRGFIPASRLSDEYVEDLKEFDGKTIEVTVITADEETHRLVLSGREAAREKKQEETNKKIAKCEVGAVMKGTVETLKDYGAFVELENGLTGLLHISQISTKRIKHPGAVLKEGQEVRVKIISTANNKISLSMKELIEEEEEREAEDTYGYKEEGQASTGLADLLKGLKL